MNKSMEKGLQVALGGFKCISGMGVGAIVANVAKTLGPVAVPLPNKIAISIGTAVISGYFHDVLSDYIDSKVYGTVESVEHTVDQVKEAVNAVKSEGEEPINEPG